MMTNEERDTCIEAACILRNMTGIDSKYRDNRYKWAEAIETQYMIGATEYDTACVNLALSIVYAEKCRVKVAEPSNEMIKARLAQLESEIDEASPVAQKEMLAEIIDLRNKLQLDGDDGRDPIDDYAFGRALLKAGPL